MNFGFTEEQEMLRAEVRKFLDERCPMTEVRRISETDEGYSAELWNEMAELGWLGLLVPEAYGGAGLGWVDLVALLEETGRTLLPSPLLGSILAGAAIESSGSEEQKRRWLPGIADGSQLFTLALLEAADLLGPEGVTLPGEREGEVTVLTGEKLFVPDAATATHFVVSFRNGAGPEEVAKLPTIDTTKRLGKLTLDGARVGSEAVLPGSSDGWAAVARLIDCATAAVTAEMIGAAEAAHALTVQYAKDRVQFGSPIGRFQGVKHPLADMYVDIESFKSLLYYAAWCLDESPAEAPRYVSMAKAYASDAFTRIGIAGIELHGGLGSTWEYDAQLYLKRSKWAKAMFGGSDHHYGRVASLGGV
jgi:alkylation response protein AidB-like acyl-CoA dehydrogenase